MIEIKSSMAGTIFKVLVSQGDRVEKGQDVVILESMKMEVPIEAPDSGTVQEIKIIEGSFVGDGDVLIKLE